MLLSAVACLESRLPAGVATELARPGPIPFEPVGVPDELAAQLAPWRLQRCLGSVALRLASGGKLAIGLAVLLCLAGVAGSFEQRAEVAQHPLPT